MTHLSLVGWPAGERGRAKQNGEDTCLTYLPFARAGARAYTNDPHHYCTCKVPEAEWYLAASVPDVYELPPAATLSTNQKDTSIPLRFPRLSILT